MGFDTPLSAVNFSDKNSQVVNVEGDRGSDFLHKLQEGAGLHDKPGDNKFFKPDPELIIKKLDLDKEPTDRERADAEKTLESRMSKLIPEGDRATMTALTNAITSGDSKEFAEALQKAGGDPAKLKKIVEEVDKILQEKGSPVRLDMTADGKVLVSDGGKGLSFDPKTGAVEAKQIEQNMDGSVRVLPGEVLHTNKEKDFKEMGNHAVDGINGVIHFQFKERLYNPPHWKGPDFPGFPHQDPRWFMEKQQRDHSEVLKFN